MNTGFSPIVVAPHLFKVQTATQQPPFKFGGSQVPKYLGGRGMVTITVPRHSVRTPNLK